MIWIMLFCSHIHYGVICNDPMEFKSKESCIFVANNFREVRRRASISQDGFVTNDRLNLSSARCVGIKK